MQPFSRLAWPLVVATVLSLSGCAADPSLYVGGAKGVPVDAPHETGEGSTPIKVLVVKETGSGEPAAGAAVVIYPIERPAYAPTLQALMSANATLGARTATDGSITAKLDLGRTYTFVAAMPNWTQEARHLVKITRDHRERGLVITLFQTLKTAEVMGSVPTTPRFDLPLIRGGGTLAANPVWFPKEILFHTEQASNRQYVHRLMTASHKLTYTVDAGDYAVFGLRAGFLAEGETEPSVYWQVNRARPPTQSPVGSFSETLELQPPQLALGDALRNARFLVGPITTEGVLAPDGIQWKVETESTFSTDYVEPGFKPTHYRGVPGPVPGLVILGLLGVAAALRPARRP